MWYAQVSCSGAYLAIAHVLLQKQSYLWFRAIKSLVLFLGHLYYIMSHKSNTYLPLLWIPYLSFLLPLNDTVYTWGLYYDISGIQSYIILCYPDQRLTLISLGFQRQVVLTLNIPGQISLKIHFLYLVQEFGTVFLKVFEYSPNITFKFLCISSFYVFWNWRILKLTHLLQLIN